jgi:hypothetical protein
MRYRTRYPSHHRLLVGLLGDGASERWIKSFGIDTKQWRELRSFNICCPMGLIGRRLCAPGRHPYVHGAIREIDPLALNGNAAGARRRIPLFPAAGSRVLFRERPRAGVDQPAGGAGYQPGRSRSAHLSGCGVDGLRKPIGGGVESAGDPIAPARLFAELLAGELSLVEGVIGHPIIPSHGH